MEGVRTFMTEWGNQIIIIQIIILIIIIPFIIIIKIGIYQKSINRLIRIELKWLII